MKLSGTTIAFASLILLMLNAYIVGKQSGPANVVEKLMFWGALGTFWIGVVVPT